MAAMPMLMITSCKKEAAKQTANVQFKLTDAPANFDALNIDVTGIQVHSTTSGWITLNSNLGVINILNYVNGSTTVIAQGDFPAGSIDQVRLMLGSNNSVSVNGATHPLQASASAQGGLTLNLSGQLQAGNSYVWTIDFDAAQSVLATSGSFQLTPVIRLIASATSSSSAGGNSGSSGINIGGSGSGTVNVGGSTGSGNTAGSVVVSGNTTGNITGSVSPIGLASVCIAGSGGQSVCTMTDLTGHFTIQAINTGSYSVTVTPTLPLLSAQTVSNVSVTAGSTTSLGVITLQ